MAVRTTRMVLSLTVPVIVTLLIAVFVNQNRSKPHPRTGLLRYQNFQTGDIIFHQSTSAQSKAIQLATHSPYSHMGIIYEEDGHFFVYEAVKPVRLTSLNTWIKRGENSRYVVKRLKDVSLLTPENLARMKSIGNTFRGKDYDAAFEWSDDKIYCSELVWKIYHKTFGLELGSLQRLGDFDLSNEVVQAKLKERYGDQVPLNEQVISPAAIFDSHLLETVPNN